MTDTNVTQLVINELTKAQYDALQPQSNQLYLVTDEVPLDSSDIATTINSSSTNSKAAGAKAVYDYVGSNPGGYISGITSSMVTTALGYTPYNSTNPNNYISGITSLMVTTALGYTPYNSTNPSGYQTASDVTTSISNHNVSQVAHQDIRNSIVTTLGGLSDVSVSGATSGQFLSYNGTNWVPVTSSSSINWGSIGGTLSSQTDLQNALDAKQATLPSGTTGYYLQKTANGVTWSEVQSAPAIDNSTITKNSSDQLQASSLAGLTATVTELNYSDGVTSNIQTQLNGKAPLASPALTGTPTSTTPSTSDNSTRIATTAFVKSQGYIGDDILVDLSNAASLIVGYGAPDYDSRVSKSINTTITADAYGYILWYTNDVTSSTLNINGFTVARATGVNGYWSDNNCVLFPISPNDTYIASAAVGLYFIPCKGV